MYGLWSKLSLPLSLFLSLSLSLSSRAQEEREREAQLRGPPKLNRDEAATRIQKVQETKRKMRQYLCTVRVHL